MATAYKNTKIQGTAGLTTYATLYNTTASTTAVVSSISICNTSTAPKKFRIGIDDTAGTPNGTEWLVYDAILEAFDTIFITAGVTLGNNQYIRVSSESNTCTFMAFISEIT